MDALHDITLPEAVSWMPQTIGWSVLAIVLVLAIGHTGWSRWRTWAANRYRREALGELADIEAAIARHEDTKSLAAAFSRLPVLLKRVALSVAPRSTVATLSGEAWLDFLDASFGRDAFRRGPGRHLPALTYAAPDTVVSIDGADRAALLRLVEDWIREHDPTAMQSVSAPHSGAG